jgi:peptide/nickel transport system permease protein
MMLPKVIRYGLVFLIIASLNFIIPRMMPGDPLMHLLGESCLLSETTLAQYQKELGLDRPLRRQYCDYWRRLVQGDLGYSYHFQAKVSALILSRIPWTLGLTGIAVILGLLGGGFLGARAGWEPQKRTVSLSTGFWSVVYCTPSYLTGLILLYLFAYHWPLLPLKGFYETGSWIDRLRHGLLPILVLTFNYTARNYLIMRGSVIQERMKPYVWYARAKGLQRSEILWRHVVKNAALPLLTLVALDFGFIFSGTLFVETVFSLNGMGTLIYEALLSRDYPVLQGALLVITVMTIIANMGADIGYGMLAPRSRGERGLNNA